MVIAALTVGLGLPYPLLYWGDRFVRRMSDRMKEKIPEIVWIAGATLIVVAGAVVQCILHCVRGEGRVSCAPIERGEHKEGAGLSAI